MLNEFLSIIAFTRFIIIKLVDDRYFEWENNMKKNIERFLRENFDFFPYKI